MVGGMNMFRQRSLRSPSPYRNERIAFLDPHFTSLWCLQYVNDFVGHEKSFTFPNGFAKHYNGVAPDFAVTNKKWVEDVDTLYIAHNISDRHWVAVEVDLLTKRVKVYDSIFSAFPETEVKKSVRPYMKLIPLLLKHLAPKEQRKKMGECAYNFYRMKQVPQNTQSGDCGVYTLKCIECLALGCSLFGINDTNVADIRLKYAAEIMDEVPLSDFVQMSCPYPRGTFDGDREGLQTDSLE